MITIQTLTIAIVVAFFFGALVGCALMGIASNETYNDGFKDGYRKGKEESNANDSGRNKEKLQVS